MDKTISVFESEIGKVRGGRASTLMVDDLKANYYGTPTPLKQLAAIHVTDPKTILIQAFDKNALADIESAIRASDLNLNPVNDGSNIRLILPPLSEERRDELVKLVRAKGEEANVSMRVIRQEAWQKIKDLEADKKITEDDRYRAEEEVNKIVAQNKSHIDSILESKEKELKEI